MLYTVVEVSSGVNHTVNKQLNDVTGSRDFDRATCDLDPSTYCGSSRSLQGPGSKCISDAETVVSPELTSLLEQLSKSVPTLSSARV